MKRRFPRPRHAEATAEPGSTLLLSALGEDTGGGIWVLEGSALAAIDDVSSTGLAVSADQRRLARLYWLDDANGVPGEIVIYDHAGIAAHYGVDDLREAHSVQWSRDSLVVVSTGTNEVLWVGTSGEVERRWRAPGSGDCWHLNSLSRRGRRLLVSAFGRFSESRGWGDPSAREQKGVVIDMRSRRDVLTGLTAPHNPVWLEGCWLICNSGRGEVQRLDRKGRILEHVTYDGWTRGLAWDESFIYVGVSAHRLRGANAGGAFVAVLTRNGFEEVERWSIPSREIYDIVLVHDSLVSGLRAGSPTATSITSKTC